jgi:hypothetical protein
VSGITYLLLMAGSGHKNVTSSREDLDMARSANLP